MSQFHLDYLEQLEAESIHIFREIAAQFEKAEATIGQKSELLSLLEQDRRKLADEVEKLEKQLVSDRKSLRAGLQEKKAKVRESKS